MRRNEHRLAPLQRGGDLLVPQRQAALDRVFEAFALGQRRGVDARVERVDLGIVLGAGHDGRRRHVVAAAPHLDLCLAELGHGLLLVLALQRAVVALVQPPVLDNRIDRDARERRTKLGAHVVAADVDALDAVRARFGRSRGSPAAATAKHDDRRPDGVVMASGDIHIRVHAHVDMCMQVTFMFLSCFSEPGFVLATCL